METKFEDIECNIQEFAFITGLHPSYASDIFKRTCAQIGKPYKPKMRLTIRELASPGRENLLKMIEKVRDVHENYMKRYESKMNMLNNPRCIETGLWGSSKNAPVKVFLKQEDIEKIESNWKIKRDQFYSQQTLFNVENRLYVPKKSNRKKSEKKISNPN